MDELKGLTGDAVKAAERFRDVMSGSPVSAALPKGLVSWYYFDPSSPADACASIGSDIGHRLALPDLFGKVVLPADARPYYVLVALAEKLDDPRRPRFPDGGQLHYLEVWRPGGRTEPWIPGCKGLNEAVAPPLAFGIHAVAIAFVMCHDPVIS